MFVRFFNIVLIASYYFCGYAQITGNNYVYNLKEIVFTESKNHNPAKTQFFSATLPKHIHTFNQIELGDHANDIWINVEYNRSLIALYLVHSENDLLKLSLDSPLNKAPPLSFL